MSKKLKYWFLALRPWSIPMSLLSITIGEILSPFKGGEFSWLIYGLSVITVALMHIASNLVNDYYDVKIGVDDLKSATAQYRPHPLVEGKIRLKDIMVVILVSYGIAFITGMILVYLRGVELLIFGLLGGVLGFTYTGPPFKYKYIALGEVIIFIIWGPLLVGSGYFLQTGGIDTSIILISIPIGISTAMVLFANNIRDIENDRTKGVKTVAIYLGKDISLLLFSILISVCYLWIAILILARILPILSLVVFITIPLSYKTIKQFFNNIPSNADALIGKVVNSVYLLLIMSLTIQLLF